MKIKKVLGLLTVMIAVFGFSTGAFAAWGDPICTTCKGCTIDRVYCDIPEDQGAVDCRAFDYDERVGGDGYCGGTTTACKAIFNICNCADASNFDSGETIGVRMTILVDGAGGENGAYWSDGATANVAMNQYATAALACEGSTPYTKAFGAGKFYKSDLTTQVTTLTADTTCVVPAANQATVIVTDITAGYTITSADELAKLSHWWIDIAPIRIDPNVLNSNELISVKIELMNQASGGICADCTAVCECVIDVAKVCCDEVELLRCMYFPYVVTQDATWGTGIVVTNLDSDVDIADMEATFTLTDSAGDVFTYTKTDFDTKVWPFMLDTELPNFSGTPAPGPAWLKVETNFYLDGYHFMTDGVFGAGTLPRPCYVDMLKSIL